MSFEDPFASDLGNFNSIAASLRRQGASASVGSVGTLGGIGFSTAAASVPVSTAGFSLGTSNFPSSGARQNAILPGAVGGGALTSSAPVAGRRARGGDAAPLSSPSPVPSSAPLASSAAVTAANPLPVSPQPTSGLSWLDDPNEGSPAGNVTAHPMATMAVTPAALSTSHTIQGGRQHTPAEVNDDPLGFLDPSGSSGGLGTAVLHVTSSVPGGSGTQGGTASSSPTAKAVDAVAVERAAELRELYATLSALEQEQQRLDDRLDARELKEETELLKLETEIATKTQELEERTDEQEQKQAEINVYTASKLDNLSSRYKKEMDEQTAEVRSLESERFERQLTQLRTTYDTVSKAVADLRRQANLLVEANRFSGISVRLQLAYAEKTSTKGESQMEGEDNENYTEDGARASNGGSHSSDKDKGGNSLTPSASSEKAVDDAQASLGGSMKSKGLGGLDASLCIGAELLRSYCNERLQSVRGNIVDSLHNHTLSAAHSVRRRREEGWISDTVERKATFSAYLQDVMRRYMSFYRERALLRQDRITSLQSELKKAATEMRSRTTERLQGLLHEVSGRMQLSTLRLEESAKEAHQLQDKKVFTVSTGDDAMFKAQCKEVKSRLDVELRARRQRHQAEKKSCQDHLERLKVVGERSGRDLVQDLLVKARSTSANQAAPLATEVSALRARLDEKLRGSGTSETSASAVSRMHADELSHVVKGLLAQVGTSQQEVARSRQRCGELRHTAVDRFFKGLVTRLRDARCAQHSHQARIDATRVAWESDHRHNLAATCSLTLPISGSSEMMTDTEYVVDTLAAPQGVVATALLDVLRDKVLAQDARLKQIFKQQRGTLTSHCHTLGTVIEQQAYLHASWRSLYETMRLQSEERQRIQEERIEVEQGLAVARERRHSVGVECRAVQRRARRVQSDFTSYQKRTGNSFPFMDGMGPRVSRIWSGCGAVSPVAVVKRSVSSSVVASPQLANLKPPGDPVSSFPQATTAKFTAVHVSTNTSPHSHSPSVLSAAVQLKCGDETAVSPSASPPTSLEQDLSPGTMQSVWSVPWASTLVRSKQVAPNSSTTPDRTSLVSPPSEERGEEKGPTEELTQLPPRTPLPSVDSTGLVPIRQRPPEGEGASTTNLSSSVSFSGQQPNPQRSPSFGAPQPTAATTAPTSVMWSSLDEYRSDPVAHGDQSMVSATSWYESSDFMDLVSLGDSSSPSSSESTY